MIDDVDDLSALKNQDEHPDKPALPESIHNPEQVVRQPKTTADMEVHHHTHTERKKFKHYAFEFFMLFFAVFCGFLADFFLEERIERHREHQYVESLVRDLKADSLNLDATRKSNDELEKSYDTLIAMIREDHLKDSALLCYKHFLWTTDYFIFYPTERTIKQLQNAGGMRLIIDKKASDTISWYYERLKQTIEQGVVMMRYFDEYMKQGQAVFDMTNFFRGRDPYSGEMYSLLIPEKVKFPMSFITLEKGEIQKLFNKLFTMRFILDAYDRELVTTQKNVSGCLSYLQKRYDVK